MRIIRPPTSQTCPCREPRSRKQARCLQSLRGAALNSGESKHGSAETSHHRSLLVSDVDLPLFFHYNQMLAAVSAAPGRNVHNPAGSLGGAPHGPRTITAMAFALAPLFTGSLAEPPFVPSDLMPSSPAGLATTLGSKAARPNVSAAVHTVGAGKHARTAAISPGSGGKLSALEMIQGAVRKEENQQPGVCGGESRQTQKANWNSSSKTGGQQHPRPGASVIISNLQCAGFNYIKSLL